MENIHVVYLVLSILFAGVMAYMFLYNTHLHPNERTMALKGRPPMSKEEGIAIATLEKEREHKIGRF